MASEAGGFPPGWQVRIPEGAKRIDQVGVGDLVLSASGDGSGAPQPRRVTGVHRREGRTIRSVLGGIVGQGVGRGAALMAADATMLWVESRGWTRADRIEIDMRVRLFDGASEIFRNNPVYRTSRENVGWIQQERAGDLGHGTLFDVVKHETIDTGKLEYLEPAIRESSERHMRTTVLDLEVEDFHTYYVNGYWARCA